MATPMLVESNLRIPHIYTNDALDALKADERLASIGVNLSGYHHTDPEFNDHLAAALTDCGYHPLFDAHGITVALGPCKDTEALRYAFEDLKPFMDVHIDTNIHMLWMIDGELIEWLTAYGRAYARKASLEWSPCSYLNEASENDPK